MTTQRLVWMNGQLVSGDRATVPILSHGFSRGSAIFESFGVHDSPQGPAAYRMDEHLKRLRRSADLLGMEMAYDEAQIADARLEILPGVAHWAMVEAPERAAGLLRAHLDGTGL